MLAPAPTRLNQNYFAASGSNCVLKPSVNPASIPPLAVYNMLAKYIQCNIKEKKGIDVNMPSFASLAVPVYGILHWKHLLTKLEEAEQMPDLVKGGSAGLGNPLGNVPAPPPPSNSNKGKKIVQKTGSPLAYSSSKFNLGTWIGSLFAPGTQNNSATNTTPPLGPPQTNTGGGATGGYGTNADPFMQNILGGGGAQPESTNSQPGNTVVDTKSNTIKYVLIGVVVLSLGYVLLHHKAA